MHRNAISYGLHCSKLQTRAQQRRVKQSHWQVTACDFSEWHSWFDDPLCCFFKPVLPCDVTSLHVWTDLCVVRASRIGRFGPKVDHKTPKRSRPDRHQLKLYLWFCVHFSPPPPLAPPLPLILIRSDIVRIFMLLFVETLILRELQVRAYFFPFYGQLVFCLPHGRSGSMGLLIWDLWGRLWLLSASVMKVFYRPVASPVLFWLRLYLRQYLSLDR